MYDVIGDVHGHADELTSLLEQLGYRQRDGVYRHHGRHALFVGDFIDRGPQIAETLRLVRKMVDAGSAHAVMGNHEFNAIAYHTEASHRRSGYLRAHSAKNNRQHAETLKQLTDSELADAIRWFRTLPISLELDGLRVVHACWSEADRRVIDDMLAHYGAVDDDFMAAATDGHSKLFDAIENILKGPEMQLPDGQEFEDKDGRRRTRIRVQWFRYPEGDALGQYAFPPADDVLGSLGEHFHPPVEPYGVSEPPVFFGHYWLRGSPRLQTLNTCCVDYSVANGGALTAYQWDGEAELSVEKILSVDAA